MRHTIKIFLFFVLLACCKTTEVVVVEGLKVKSKIANGEKNGKSKVYDSSGNLKTAATYKNGKLNGYLTNYNQDGIIVEKTKYENGVFVYNSKTFYPNGKVKQEIKLINTIDNLHSITDYYFNGKVKQIQYKKACSGFLADSFNLKNGVIKAGHNYTNEKRFIQVDKFAKYYNNGNLNEIGSYDTLFVETDSCFFDEKQNFTCYTKTYSCKKNTWRYYDSTGVLLKTELWNKGTLIETK
jgi:antitoxin component YwqK of YwqJK toxin-antitoxin module